MSRRPKTDCPLCALPDDTWAAIWRAYADSRDYSTAAAQAAAHGLACDEQNVREHLQYHRPVQPAPAGNLKRADALQRAHKLPERLRNIILACSRVPGLSGSQIAELFYWNGTDKQRASARNACY